MTPLTSVMRFDTRTHGQGIFIRDSIIMSAWGINEITKFECPVSIGNSSHQGGIRGQFDIGSIGAFTFICGRPHNRYNYRETNIDAESIGRFCMISQGVQVGVGGHPVNSISSSAVFSKGNAWTENFYDYANAIPWLELTHQQYTNSIERKIPILGNDVWVGINATVLNGVTIGDGAIVAAGATVADDVPPYTIVGGVPAKVIRQRFDNTTTDILIRSRWWEYGPDILVGLDIYTPYEAAKLLEQRVLGGFPRYVPDVFEFDWQNNTVHYIEGEKREFYGYIDRL